jgi:UDP-3-O-[3-hydroxymyristoyl] glucosamine N-acyltransferase
MLLSDLAARAGATLDGDGAVDVDRVATLDTGGRGAIAFLANAKYRFQLATTSASAVIVSPDVAAQTALPKLVSANPYLTFARVAAILNPEPAAAPGVHPTAVVGAGARIAASASVGPLAAIGAGATVGERARIGAHCALGDGVAIGDDALLHARVTIYHGCMIGPRTIVHSGAVIGADGFGMAEAEGRWHKIPQVGRVVIGADVEVGANTTIDRGAIDDTVIEEGVKLDNQIQIGHNAHIGAHTAIAACTGISGSARIGRHCKIGGAAMINGHLSIADGTVISAGTGVMKSIDVPGVYMSVFPMLPHEEWRHVAVEIRRLRKLAQRVTALERAARDGGKGGDGE